MATDSTKTTNMKQRLIVTAIDIGTTYSGWAYSSLNEPEKVYANQTWYADEGSLASLKTSSCLLFTPDKKFKYFGYKAESEFVRLAGEKKHQGWYFFKRFKMALLNDQKLNRYTTIDDISGREMPALVVFANAIKFLKDNFMATIRKRVPSLKDTDVTYVLTVPAIWNDMAKRFMREAAVEAGIPNNQLVIALEPEAASVWCQGLKTEIQRCDEMDVLGISAVGTRYMIVDLGGGTADITVHEKRPNNTLLEIHEPIGGPWGGTEVDKNFIELFEVLFGASDWEEYKRNELEDLLYIYRDFEAKKRNLQLLSPKQMILQVPVSLKEHYERNKDRSVSEIEHLFDGNIIWQKDKLKIDASLIMKCFEGPVQNVICNVEEILSKRKMRNVSKIILVGGFSESNYVQERFTAKFTDWEVITPVECGLAVLKGAVLFGQNQSVVTARIARYTYGLDIAVPFDLTKHPTEKLVYTDVGRCCKDSFWKAVEIGQEIKDGHEVSRIGRAVNDFQDHIILTFFKSTERDPLFTTDKGCEAIGKIDVPMECTLKADENAVEQIFIFGGTELRFKSKHITRGDTHELNIDL
ncbi:heat shock 70 kDa protein 12B-like [Ruditapes philippinarum]|uniref:heat shock 70 kDa protein 12B-like n=1 Tax=Ruditapes philippinarum TaxID=129788 RepID=UPI00295A637C|nr:heat shock 70 kDa protein 12B-like [Ruditapes philippinarum]